MNYMELDRKIAEGRALVAEGAMALAERRRRRAELRVSRKRQQREALALAGEGKLSPLRLLSAGEVKIAFGLSRQQLDNLNKDGRLHRIDGVGKHARWRAGDVQRFVEGL